ncbi:MAG: hypothetical protein WCT29_03415 [Candidatus Paceibacterota bacterium]|jgi:hypothetical protein
MEILGKIFGSSARVKVMRLFLFNRGKSFENKEVLKRCRITQDVGRRELNLLASVGFIKKRGQVLSFNPFFKYGAEFEDLLLGSDTMSHEAILENFKKVGRIKLFILSGVFIKNRDSRADLLIVGDRLKRGKIEEAIRKIEAELGGELLYVVFDTKEFLYRLDMYDKLVRDILDFPHEVILQAKELSTQLLKKV